MKKIFYTLNAMLLLSLFIIFQGCSEDPQPSIYELAEEGNPAPVIQSISPSEAIAGVTEITITGTNFSPVVEENTIYFDGQQGTVLSATTTQLIVVPANVVSDTAKVKVAVRGSVPFSNIVTFKLTPAVSEVLNSAGSPIFSDLVKATAITLDNQNNIYFSQSGAGVKKITSTGEVSDFAPKGAETVWFGLKYGPAATLYGTRNARGVWKINEGTTPTSSPWKALPTGTSGVDLDFDANKNLWVVGNNNSVIYVPETGSVKSFPFVASLRSARIFQNALYVAGTKAGVEGVWKFPIIGTDSLGQEELYFNLSSYDTTAGIKLNAITFAADGDLYIGTNRANDPILIVHPDKSVEYLYPGVITPNTEVLYFSWDTGNFLYFVRNTFGTLTQAVMKVNMEKPGAPYYGRL